MNRGWAKQKEQMKVIFEKIWGNFRHFLKWVTISAVIGAVVGLVGVAFVYALTFVTELRENYPVIVLGLPFGGILIVALYHMAHRQNDRGTNLVLDAIRAGVKVPVRIAPLIMISTIITHLFGGSAGREGAALQLGGSIASGFGKLFRMSSREMNGVIMCGMSAAFSALFGTPMAAAVFSLEVVSVGIMYYSALVPCVIASLLAHYVALTLGVRGESFRVLEVPAISISSMGWVILLAGLCALVSILFCVVLHQASALQKKWIANPYLRVVAAGVLIILLTRLLGTEDYLGAGMGVIERCMTGEVKPEAFLWKILFTALTLGAGYKGGEIVPSFFVGATFGCLAGQLVGVSPSLCAAIGLTAVFCGVTNCPITSLLMALELFGMEAMPFFLLAVAVSYMLSGHYGLYHSQKILYSKYQSEYLEGIGSEKLEAPETLETPK